ncbi:MAG: CDP-alcohol phosphatidyltransferase family protein [Patescibacteria group bacterium]|nr:CDP-alcohol phosphatidyltransferase family protein [Patescibacteria group bacterium]
MENVIDKAKKIVFQNSANVVTAIGIILTVWFNMLIWNEPVDYLLIFLLTASIGISDLLDGWLSRRWKIGSSMGGFLDKFRDKLFSCSVFAYFIYQLWNWSNGIWLGLIKGLIILILAIELFLVLIWIIGFVKGCDTNSHLTGKIKTGFYFTAISWWFCFKCLEDLLQKQLTGDAYYFVLIILLFIGSIYGILSVAAYIQRDSSFAQDN